MPVTPTARTKQWLQKQGWLVGITEKWNPHAKIRQDLFGFADLVAIPVDLDVGDEFSCSYMGWSEFLVSPPVFIQVTSGTNHAARRDKLLENENVRKVLKCCALVAIISWSKRGAKGKRKIWTPRLEWIESHMMKVSVGSER